ncbi:hypothetical protein COM24_23330 [Bacillus toyonensis]|uniref:hypothetical protein n=1 Tax=Bacillus toyonensis TaxID=155322 RepID=UPI000BF3DD3D|nr:hypothetical protein [Bacillus toyonensis]PGC48714.1 hypothetical protein COM24_23330 [Bacillus toyonensis]
MALTPVPNLSVPQNKGFKGTDSLPIIHSIRWRHLPSRYIFKDVDDVITYHSHGPLTIDINKHGVSYLDVYFLKDTDIVEVTAYIRFLREKDQLLIEEPYKIGEAGAVIALEDDEVNHELRRVKGIAFTQKDLGDGTPMYDFINMSKEGIYEVWIKVITGLGKEMHLRVPFQWVNLVPSIPPEKDGHDSDNAGKDNKKSEYNDEYYVTIVEGDSAFTKRPSTHFRMAGIGMLKDAGCFKRIETPVLEPISRPSKIQIINDIPTSSCGLNLITSRFNKVVGEVVTFSLVHTNRSGILRIDTNYDKNGLKSLGNGTFKVINKGVYKVTFIVTYNDGQECITEGTIIGEFICELNITGPSLKSHVGDSIVLHLDHGQNSSASNIGVLVQTPPKVIQTGNYTFTSSSPGVYSIKFIVDYGFGVCEKIVSIEFISKNIPPEKPEGEGEKPDKNVLKCGQTAQGGMGYGEYIHAVSEEGICYVEYDFFSAPDRMRVFVNNELIYDTSRKMDKEGSPFGFYYKPDDGELRVVMNDGQDKGSRWSYTLYCGSSVPSDVKLKAKIIN